MLERHRRESIVGKQVPLSIAWWRSYGSAFVHSAHRNQPKRRKTLEIDMSKKGGNKAKLTPKLPMANKGPKKK